MSLPTLFADFLPSEQNRRQKILACNTATARFGLLLTPAEAHMVADTQKKALAATNRIEFSDETIPKIIYAFCDSSFIPPNEYAETLARLTEIFYHFKNETNNLLSDDELIHTMSASFNGVCQGSLSLLAERELERLVYCLNGCDPILPEENGEDLNE